MSEGEEGMEEMCDSAGSEARRFHEERGGKGEGGSGVGPLCVIWRRVTIFMRRVCLVLRRIKLGVFESFQKGMPVLCV